MSDSFNDFSSTFMLDEELELEHKTIENSHHSALERYIMLFQFLFFDLYLNCPKNKPLELLISFYLSDDFLMVQLHMIFLIPTLSNFLWNMLLLDYIRNYLLYADIGWLMYIFSYKKMISKYNNDIQVLAFFFCPFSIIIMLSL